MHAHFAEIMAEARLHERASSVIKWLSAGGQCAMHSRCHILIGVQGFMGETMVRAKPLQACLFTLHLYGTAHHLVPSSEKDSDTSIVISFRHICLNIRPRGARAYFKKHLIWSKQ